MVEGGKKRIIITIYGDAWSKINKNEEKTRSNDFITNLSEINGSTRVK